MLGGLSRATLLHGFGGLENGMSAAYEALVLGDELAGYAKAFLRDVPLDDDALAVEEIAAAGPGGNHLGTKYTRRHYREFWTSELFDDTGYRALASRGLSDAAGQGARPRGAPSRASRALSRLASSQLAELDAIVAGGFGQPD